MSDFSTAPQVHGSREDAAGTFAHTIGAVMVGSSWMGVMFEVLPDGQLRVHRTTYQFPKHLMMSAIDQLRRLMQEELREIPRDPLPMAERFRMRAPHANDAHVATDGANEELQGD